MLRWVALERASLWKPRSALRPGPSGSLSLPSSLRKLFSEAQASSSVPSTEKWSDEISRFTRGWAKTARRNLAAISPASSRSRFLVKLE